MDQQIPAAKDWRGIPAANLSGAFRDPRLTIFKLPLASFPHSCSKFIGHIGSDHSNEALIDDVRLEVMRLAFRGQIFVTFRSFLKNTPMMQPWEKKTREIDLHFWLICLWMFMAN